SANGGFYPTVVSGVSVQMNGFAAPLLYVSASQVTAVVPYGVTGATVQVSVQYQSLIPFSASFPLVPTAPAVFTVSGKGRGQAIAYNESSVQNDLGHPALSGSLLTFYATGEGQTSPTGIDGKVGTAPLPRPGATITVTIGGQNATVVSANGAPGLVAGIMQV